MANEVCSPNGSYRVNRLMTPRKLLLLNHAKYPYVFCTDGIKQRVGEYDLMWLIDKILKVQTDIGYFDPRGYYRYQFWDLKYQQLQNEWFLLFEEHSHLQTYSEDSLCLLAKLPEGLRRISIRLEWLPHGNYMFSLPCEI